MATVACYLVYDSCVSFIHDFSSINLLFSDTTISGMDNGVMLLKSRTEDT
jgi:hypothetical protein